MSNWLHGKLINQSPKVILDAHIEGTRQIVVKFKDPFRHSLWQTKMTHLYDVTGGMFLLDPSNEVWGGGCLTCQVWQTLRWGNFRLVPVKKIKYGTRNHFLMNNESFVILALFLIFFTYVVFLYFDRFIDILYYFELSCAYILPYKSVYFLCVVNISVSLAHWAQQRTGATCRVHPAKVQQNGSYGITLYLINRYLLRFCTGQIRLLSFSVWGESAGSADSRRASLSWPSRTRVKLGADCQTSASPSSSPRGLGLLSPALWRRKRV